MVPEHDARYSGRRGTSSPRSRIQTRAQWPGGISTLFRATASHYDRVYAAKNYAKEAARVRELIAAHGPPNACRLLDVACGTGQHLAQFAEDFEVSGVDLDPGMLAVARDRLPGVLLVEGDMMTFDLGQRFDVVTCLFSSVGYLDGTAALTAAARRFARHLAPGGLCIIEPWIEPSAFRAGHVHLLTVVDEQVPTVARMATNRVEGRRATIFMEYLFGYPDRLEHFREEHRTTLFTRDEVLGALHAAGLQAFHEPSGFDFTDRGLFLAWY